MMDCANRYAANEVYYFHCYGGIMEDSPYSVEPFRPIDAELIPRLFREVYGDAYPVKMVYDAEEMIAASEKGHYFPFVVRTSPDRIVGFGALYQSAPYKGMYEFGQGVVSPEFRGAGIGRLLFEYAAHYAPALPGAEIYFGEAVCNHTHTQKAGALIHTIETGIEVDLLPGEVYTKYQKVSGRVAVVDMFRTYVSKPHTIHAPAIYENILRYICAGFDDSRVIEPASDEPPSIPESRFSTQVFPTAGVARLAVIMAGGDFESAFDTATRAIQNNKDIKVIQVWLNLSCPWIEPFVDALRKRGYFFGGYFPRWFDEDGLLMQKVLGQPNWNDIQLFSTRAGEIFDFIHSDWAGVRQNAETCSGVLHEHQN
jgi:GNAT superfamily N-acetyltransferase